MRPTQPNAAGDEPRLRDRLAGEGLGAILVRGAAGSAGAQLSGALMALLAQLLLARLLGVTEYGYYVYALTWVVICAQLSRLGLQDALVRFTAAYRAEGDGAALRGLTRRAAQLAGAAAVVAALLLVAVVSALQHRLAPGQYAAFLVAALVIPPMTALGITQGLLQGCRRTAKAVLPVRTFVHGGLLVLAAAVGATVGLDSAVAAMGLTLAAALGACAVAVFWVRTTLGPDTAGHEPTHRTGYWVRASLPLLLMAGMQVLMKQTDTAMLGALTGTDAAGLYYPVARMSELAAIGLLAGNAIVAPLISELHTRGERERLQRLLTLAAAGISAVTLVATAAFWLVGEWLLGLFGPAFTGGHPALLVLLGGQLVAALCGPAAFLMTMTGDQDRASLVLVGGALLNVALNALLIPAFGLMGAAAATATSTACWSLWMRAEVVRRHRLNPSLLGRRHRTPA